MIPSLALLASALSALSAGLLIRRIIPPPRRLGTRMEPYLAPTQALRGGNTTSLGILSQVFGPIVDQAAGAIGHLLDRSGERVTTLKLRQAGWYQGLREEEMTSAYHISQLRSVALGLGGGIAAGVALDLSSGPLLVLVGLGVVMGATRNRSRLEKAIAERRALMRIEIYTINQLLALRVRTGGGVVHAVQATVGRGRGEVVAELEDALRLHRSGWRASDAFRRIAELTPEPFCGRTYRLLASADERGAELAGALLDLSEDSRETRRESIKRAATKRRAAMLIPTIAILAPVLILFVAAPLPHLITGWR